MSNCHRIRDAAAVILLCPLLASPAAAQQLGDLYRVRDAVSGSHVEYHDVAVPKGKEVVLADLKGPAKVTYFYVTPISDMVLKIFWDDESQPSVLAPLGDFFGALRGKAVDYQSSPMQIEHGCYMCHLPMPFSKRARFVLANDSGKDYSTSMAYGIDYEQNQRYAAEKSRLHCTWRRSNPVPAGAPPLDRVIAKSQCGGKNNIDTRHTILEVKGRGHYVGDFLHVSTKNTGWWGEGVTVFHVDGKTMVHTPGTEDEYGSCWAFGGTFAYPYCGYLLKEKGNNLMYRWYVANPVRFRQSLKVEIQDIYEFGPGADDFTSVAFWYQEEPHCPFTLQPFAERTAPSRAHLVVKKEKGKEKEKKEKKK
jgi:hypothetical protein